MEIAIIDADLIGRKNHRFPNLACMKLSGWYKSQGAEVTLKQNYLDIDLYDKVFISKVFTDTPCLKEILELPNVEYGGTGFFYDKAPKLSSEIEHSFPDYHLYDDFVKAQQAQGVRKSALAYYTDYSIGFLTRGCFRKCPFCVNKNYSQVLSHSPLSEFVDLNRKKICLLDDNFLGCANWKNLLSELQTTNKPFQFKQGLDVRLLTPEKCQILFSSKYDSAYIFAFDNIADSASIIEKLKLIRKYSQTIIPVFYCFCAFDRNNIWDKSFWLSDIRDLFIRIKILGSFGCLPYIMRYKRYLDSPYKTIYINAARWCNQFSFFKKMTFVEFCTKSSKSYAKAIETFLLNFPDFTELFSTVHFRKE